ARGLPTGVRRPARRGALVGAVGAQVDDVVGGRGGQDRGELRVGVVPGRIDVVAQGALEQLGVAGVDHEGRDPGVGVEVLQRDGPEPYLTTLDGTLTGEHVPEGDRLARAGPADREQLPG